MRRTTDRKSRGPGDKLQELSLFVDIVGAEDLVEVVDGRRLTRVAVVRTTTLRQHPHRPPLKATAAEQLLQLVADTGTSDYLNATQETVTNCLIVMWCKYNSTLMSSVTHFRINLRTFPKNFIITQLAMFRPPSAAFFRN